MFLTGQKFRHYFRLTVHSNKNIKTLLSTSQFTAKIIVFAVERSRAIRDSTQLAKSGWLFKLKSMVSCWNIPTIKHNCCDGFNKISSPSHFQFFVNSSHIDIVDIENILIKVHRKFLSQIKRISILSIVLIGPMILYCII